MNHRDAANVRTLARLAGCVLFAFALLQFLCACDYARMKDDESLRTYKKSIPEMPKHTIPTTGGIDITKETAPNDLHNPLPYTQETILRGKTAYEYFCVHCHGPRGDGHATVGQSFAPLPTDLAGKYVQDQTDGEVFYRTSFGFKRHPPLAFTVSEEDRWATVHYIRFLAKKPAG
jgi:hypothetical protein